MPVSIQEPLPPDRLAGLIMQAVQSVLDTLPMRLLCQEISVQEQLGQFTSRVEVSVRVELAQDKLVNFITPPEPLSPDS
jgi:hypothetical protein